MKLIAALLFVPIVSFANCDRPISQPEITRCATAEYMQLVAELNNAVALTEFCIKTSLKQEQEVWYNSTVRMCRTSLNGDKGGSLYQHMYISCLGKYTVERIDILETKTRQCFK